MFSCVEIKKPVQLNVRLIYVLNLSLGGCIFLCMHRVHLSACVGGHRLTLGVFLIALDLELTS